MLKYGEIDVSYFVGCYVRAVICVTLFNYEL